MIIMIIVIMIMIVAWMTTYGEQNVGKALGPALGGREVGRELTPSPQGGSDLAGE